MTRHSYQERDYAFGQVMLKAEHFKHFLALCVQQRVFAPEREEEERLCCKNSQRNTLARRFPVLVGLRPPLQRGGR
jgi:hypothetical protein